LRLREAKESCKLVVDAVDLVVGSTRYDDLGGLGVSNPVFPICIPCTADPQADQAST
jgi:hypothetical protein